MEVTTLPTAELEAGHTHKGVIYYLPTYAKTTFSYTGYVNETTKALTMLCDTVVQKEEVNLLADLDRPVVVRNASGILSAAKFGRPACNAAPIVTAIRRISLR